MIARETPRFHNESGEWSVVYTKWKSQGQLRLGVSGKFFKAESMFSSLVIRIGVQEFKSKLKKSKRGGNLA
jgi:hypothetical protein